MDDLISRQALCEYALNQKDKSITPNDIMRFPSAQPETHEERTETHSCDCIERQAAIDIVQGYAEQLQGYIGMPNDSEVYAYARGLLLSIDRNIKALPSVQPDMSEYSDKLWKKAYERGKAEPQRKKGMWIDYTEDGYVECPFCHSATNCDGNKDELHFCFSCGADMREDAGEPKKCDTCKHEKERWFSRCADCSDYELWESKE